MEGALPSVIGGMTDKPIIAVPTSVGYGTSLGGMTALFAMLNSCVPGIAVMNIDNGFGAGVLAHKINMLCIKQNLCINSVCLSFRQSLSRNLVFSVISGCPITDFGHDRNRK